MANGDHSVTLVNAIRSGDKNDGRIHYTNAAIRFWYSQAVSGLSSRRRGGECTDTVTS